MKYSRFLYGVVVATAAMASTLSAQVSGSAAGQVDTARLDTAAMNALNRMATYLRTLNDLQVKATVTTEDVILDGQKIQMTSAMTLVEPPGDPVGWNAGRPNPQGKGNFLERQPGHRPIMPRIAPECTTWSCNPPTIAVCSLHALPRVRGPAPPP